MLPGNTDYAALHTAENIKTPKNVNRINFHNALVESNMESSSISSQKMLEMCTLKHWK